MTRKKFSRKRPRKPTSRPTPLDELIIEAKKFGLQVIGKTVSEILLLLLQPKQSTKKQPFGFVSYPVDVRQFPGTF